MIRKCQASRAAGHERITAETASNGRYPPDNSRNSASQIPTVKCHKRTSTHPKYGKLSATDIEIDTVFIGSCTNSRIEDLRAAAALAKGRKVAEGVTAMVVPGSGLVKEQAEEEGLDRVFLEAGFQWREPGCSMCLAMNADKLEPRERCASTSNRNFEGRQGRGGRTHLVSPQMAVAAAIAGHLADVREME